MRTLLILLAALLIAGLHRVAAQRPQRAAAIFTSLLGQLSEAETGLAVLENEIMTILQRRDNMQENPENRRNISKLLTNINASLDTVEARRTSLHFSTLFQPRLALNWERTLRATRAMKAELDLWRALDTLVPGTVRPAVAFDWSPADTCPCTIRQQPQSGGKSSDYLQLELISRLERRLDSGMKGFIADNISSPLCCTNRVLTAFRTSTRTALETITGNQQRVWNATIAQMAFYDRKQRYESLSRATARFRAAMLYIRTDMPKRFRPDN